MVARLYHPNLAADADALAGLADELIDAYHAVDSWRSDRPYQGSEVDPACSTLLAPSATGSASRSTRSSKCAPVKSADTCTDASDPAVRGSHGLAH
jgi:hypothetical protein